MMTETHKWPCNPILHCVLSAMHCHRQQSQTPADTELNSCVAWLVLFITSRPRKLKGCLGEGVCGGVTVVYASASHFFCMCHLWLWYWYGHNWGGRGGGYKKNWGKKKSEFSEEIVWPEILMNAWKMPLHNICIFRERENAQTRNISQGEVLVCKHWHISNNKDHGIEESQPLSITIALV